MATRVKLNNFLKIEDTSIEGFAASIGKTSRSIYNWLNDESAEYIVIYDARNNQVIEVVRSSVKSVYVRDGNETL